MRASPLATVVTLAFGAAVLSGTATVAAAAPCEVPFDGTCAGAACASVTTNGGATVLALDDADLNGRCEWPAGQTKISGTLRVPSPVAIEFRGNTTVRAGAIVVDAGAVLTALDTAPSAAGKLALIARNGDLSVLGTLDLVVGDDLLLEAEHGDVALLGSTTLRSRDRTTIDARQGDVSIHVAAGDHGEVFGVNNVDVFARGANGSIDIDGPVQVGARRRVTISNRAHVSVLGPKLLRVADGAVVTTDQERTGRAPTTPSDVGLEASGPIVIANGVLLDSGRNVRIQAKQAGAQVCLSQQVTIEAAKAQTGGDGVAHGRIYFTNAAAPVLDDGTTQLFGTVYGTVQPGTCGPAATATPTPPAPTATGETPTPIPTPTATVVLTDAQWRLSVRVARSAGSAVNVGVPHGSLDAPIPLAIAQDQLPSFRIGDQVTKTEIDALGGDTTSRFVSAAEQYIQAHPGDYPGVSGVLALRWVERTS